jgi:transposase
MEKLPPNYREVLILRELEGMSYKEISDITGMPAGTVMSSLSRARGQLRQILTGPMRGETVTSSRHKTAVNACLRGGKHEPSKSGVLVAVALAKP